MAISLSKNRVFGSHYYGRTDSHISNFNIFRTVIDVVECFITTAFEKKNIQEAFLSFPSLGLGQKVFIRRTNHAVLPMYCCTYN